MKKRFLAVGLVLLLLLSLGSSVAFAGGTVNTINLRVDYSKLYNYIEGIRENDVNESLMKLVSAESGEEAYYIDQSNSGLTYLNVDNVIYGVTGADDAIDPNKEYYVCFCVTMKDGYTLASLDSITVTLNGEKVTPIWPEIDFPWGTYVYIKMPAPEKMANHTHNYVYWKSDDDNHWKECTCGLKDSVDKHSYQWKVDVEPTETESGSRHMECVACGKLGESEELPPLGPQETQGSDPTETPVKTENPKTEEVATTQPETVNPITTEPETYVPDTEPATDNEAADVVTEDKASEKSESKAGGIPTKTILVVVGACAVVAVLAGFIGAAASKKKK